MAVEYDHIGAPITPDGPLLPFNSRTLLRIAVSEAPSARRKIAAGTRLV